MASRTYLSPNADVMTLAIRQRVWRKFLQVKKPEAREGMQSSRCKQEGILSPVGTIEEKKSCVQEAPPPPLPPPPLWGLEETVVLSSSVEKGVSFLLGRVSCRLSCYSPLLALAH